MSGTKRQALRLASSVPRADRAIAGTWLTCCRDPRRVKMYKVRLKRWGLSKYIRTKAEDVAALPSLVGGGEHRGPVRLASGRVVDPDRLTSHLLRKQGLSATASRRSLQPPTGRCAGTQLSPPSVMTIRPPDIFYVSEAVLAGTRAYVSGRLLNTAFASKGGCATIVTTFYAIRCYLQDGKNDEAVALLRQAPGQMYALLRYEPPRILEHLFMIMTHLHDIPEDAVSNTVKALVRYAAAVAVDLGWPRQHPLRRILSGFAALNSQDARGAQYDLAARGWRSLIEMLDARTGLPDGSANLTKWLDLGESSGYDVLPGAYLEERQWEVYRALAATHGEGSPEAAKRLFYLTELERQKHKARGGSQEDLQRLINRTLQSIPERKELLGKYNCELCQARYQKEKREVDLAERYLRVSMDTRFQTYGNQYPYCLVCITRLEGWLKDWAGDAKVAELQKWKTYMCK